MTATVVTLTMCGEPQGYDRPEEMGRKEGRRVDGNGGNHDNVWRTTGLRPS